MRPAFKILITWGRRLGHLLPPRWLKMLDSGYDLLAKFNVVEMRLSDMNRLPPVRIPEGFVAATLQPGHEQDYVDVMRQSLKKDADLKWFRQNFPEDNEYNPRNIFLVYRGKTPVAAAAAWHYEYKRQNIGHLKSVGVVPDFQGRGLGRQVSLVALHRLKDRGFQQVMLKTHRTRIRAVQLYLTLGFEPKYRFWAGKKKWRRLLSKIRKC